MKREKVGEKEKGRGREGKTEREKDREIKRDIHTGTDFTSIFSRSPLASKDVWGIRNSSAAANMKVIDTSPGARDQVSHPSPDQNQKAKNDANKMRSLKLTLAVLSGASVWLECWSWGLYCPTQFIHGANFQLTSRGEMQSHVHAKSCPLRTYTDVFKGLFRFSLIKLRSEDLGINSEMSYFGGGEILKVRSA